MLFKTSILAGIVCFCSTLCAAQNWPAPKSPAIAQADGYVVIPHVAVAPDPKTTYHVIFDATRMSSDPSSILPAVNGAGVNVHSIGLVCAIPPSLRSST